MYTLEIQAHRDNISYKNIYKTFLTGTKCSRVRQILNGGVSCSDNFNINSVCEFYCNLGYKMIGQSSIVCGKL